MPLGITQEQVFSAAEAILVEDGIQPTIARVQARLGRGSSTTITREMRVWWQTIGKKLTSQSEAVDPAAETLIRILNELRKEARQEADAALSPVRQELEARTQAIAEREVDAAEVVARAQQSIAIAEAENTGLHSRLDDQVEQLAKAATENAALTTVQDALREQLAETQRRLAVAEEKVRAESLRATGLQDTLLDSTRALGDTRTALARAEEQAAAASAELQVTKQSLAKAGEKIQRLSDDLVKAQEKIDQKSAVLDEERRHRVAQLTAHEARLTEMNLALRERDVAIGAAQEKSGRLETMLAALDAQCGTLTEDLTARREELAGRLAQVQALTDKCQWLETELAESRRRLNPSPTPQTIG